MARLIRMNERTAQRYAKQILKEGSLDRKKGSCGHNKFTNRVERKVIAHVKDSKKPFTCYSLADNDRVSKDSEKNIKKTF